MIFSTKQIHWLSFLFAGSLMCLPAQSQAQGLFGKKKHQESPSPYHSASLFPGAETSSTPSAPAPSGMAIFKDGKPQEVKETAYTIQNGERVPTETVKKQRPKLFGGLKKDAPNETKAEPVAGTVESDVPRFDPAPVARNSASSEEGEKDGWLSLPSNLMSKLPRLRRESTAPGQTSDILVNDGQGLVATVESAPSAPVVTAPAPGISKVPPVSSPSAKPTKDQTGTIIYSSWDEVQAKKTTVADKIVSDMRSQEAEQKQKVAAAQKEYGQQIAKAREEARKAEEAARMRAMLNGMMAQPGTGAGAPGGF